MQPKYSFIVPIYNEESNINQLYQRLKTVMNSMDDEVELVLINDGSKDSSIEMIRGLQRQDSRISFISFARNFGHQIAVTAGLNHVRGQVVVILDADLQDPPELIPEMVQKWRQGYDVVYAKRLKRHKEGWFKRVTAHVFYRVIKKLADVDIPTDTGDFCLLDRKVVDALNSMPERNRYIRGLRSWVGFQQTAIHFERDPRHSGEPKYTFKKSLALAINGIISFSRVPLQISTYLGMLSAAVAILMAFFVLYWRLFQPASPVNGYAIILIIVFFLGAVQLVTVGILGEYVGRIYEEVKGRPLYTINELKGFGEAPQPQRRVFQNSEPVIAEQL